MAVSRVPTTESTVHITKLVFNEDSVGSAAAAARQLEPWQPWTEALIGFLSIFVVLLLTLAITQTERKYVYPDTVQLFIYFIIIFIFLNTVFQKRWSSLCTHGTNRSRNRKRQFSVRWCSLVCGECCFCIYLTINLMQKRSLFPSNHSIMVWAPPGQKETTELNPNENGMFICLCQVSALQGGSGLLWFRSFAEWRTNYRGSAILINLSLCVTVTQPQMLTPLWEACLFLSILLT